jgi:hypothetical protein
MSGNLGLSSLTWSGDSSMWQFHESQALLGGSVLKPGVPTTTLGSHYAPTSSDGASAHPASSHAHSSSHSSSASLGVISQLYHPVSSKECEAMCQQGQTGLRLASAPEECEGVVIQQSRYHYYVNVAALMWLHGCMHGLASFEISFKKVYPNIEINRLSCDLSHSKWLGYQTKPVQVLS